MSETQNEAVSGTSMPLDLDDDAGLRMLRARGLENAKFNMDGMFGGFKRLRILTYSASVGLVLKLLQQYQYERFECVFGCEATVRNFGDILKFQHATKGDLISAISGIDKRRVDILDAVLEKRAVFYAVRTGKTHAKIYLLDDGEESDRRRVIVGSANVSEAAMTGRQHETLVCFDDDDIAWGIYERLFAQVLEQDASDEIPIDADTLNGKPIDMGDTPVLASPGDVKIINDATVEGRGEDGTLTALVVPTEDVFANIETVKKSIPPEARALTSNRRLRVFPAEKKQQLRRMFTRAKRVQSDDDVNARSFSIDRSGRTATLNGAPFAFSERKPGHIRSDVRLLKRYFRNFEYGFKGGSVSKLQKDYFTFWTWLYFSPFMCDIRANADDIFRCPSFAIVYGAPSCGKTSLIDTLMTSMFGHPYTWSKQSFKRETIYDIQGTCRRFPAVFDDISRRQISTTAYDVIKDETPPTPDEYPPFVLSMNADSNAFQDDIVKRCLMIHTTTAIPSYDEGLRSRLHLEVKGIRDELTGDLYRAFLSEVVELSDDVFYGSDWLLLASSVLVNLLTQYSDEDTPSWCQPVSWEKYAATRHDFLKGKLKYLLRPSAHTKRGDATPGRWYIDGSRIVVNEDVGMYNKTDFDWESLPSTLVNSEATSTRTKVLFRADVEDFMGERVSGGRGGILRLLTRR